MDLKLIKSDNNKDLIILLTGWGCDDRQFSHLDNEDYNVLIGYNYTNLDIDFDFSGYENFYLITFSAGVFIAGIIQDKLPKLSTKIAINGNPKSYDSYYGLTNEMKKVFLSVSKENISEFRREYLVSDDTELIRFNKNQPHRSLESCMQELKSLADYSKLSTKAMEYDKVLLSDNDKIFSINRQKEYFKDSNIKIIPNSGHFPFFKFNTFREILLY